MKNMKANPNRNYYKLNLASGGTLVAFTNWDEISDEILLASGKHELLHAARLSGEQLSIARDNDTSDDGTWSPTGLRDAMNNYLYP